MRFNDLLSPARNAVAAGAALVALSGSPAYGQENLLQVLGWKPKHDQGTTIVESCPTPAPAAPATPAPSAAPPLATTPRMDDVSLSAERSAALGGEQVALSTPNMFGDYFGGQRAFATALGRPTLLTLNATGLVSGLRLFNPSAPPGSFTGFTTDPNPQVALIVSQGSRSVVVYRGSLNTVTDLVLHDLDARSPVQAVAARQAADQYVRNERLTVRTSNLNPNGASPIHPTLVSQGVDQRLPEFVQILGPDKLASFLPRGSVVQSLTSTPASKEIVPSSQNGPFIANYNYTLTGEVVPAIVLALASPSDGGRVGRTKISEDNNPLPRDRFIFNFDYFGGVPMMPNQIDVRRFSPGFEKTFFDRSMSLEVRFPFASTLNSTVISDGITNTDTEFGNIHITYKALLTDNDVFHTAAGLGISIPTADDVSVRLTDGSELARTKNDAVILTPYIAALVTPGDRFFLQAWSQIGLPTNGNRVLVESDTGLTRAGVLTDQVLLQLDGQIGYWVVRNNDPNRWLRGLSPFLELHYNTTLTDADHIVAQNFDFTGANRIDELNLSTGLIAQVRDNFNLSAGVVLPLRTDGDRSFDYQFGIRANYFFGPMARARERATQVSGF